MQGSICVSCLNMPEWLYKSILSPGVISVQSLIYLWHYSSNIIIFVLFY